MRFLSDLALFVEVANTRSFSRAASALGIPTSTLSRRISALERELGLQLIHRSTRTFKLTDAGQTCYQQSRALVAEAMRIQSDVAGIASKTSGHIRAGVPFDLAQTIFLPLFARYMRPGDCKLSWDDGKAFEGRYGHRNPSRFPGASSRLR
jgi:DNA-binding transcriptional LysR family regulator